MRAFYLAYRQHGEFVPQLVAQIPWGHNTTLIERIKDPTERNWYLEQTKLHGWSRNILTLQIDTQLYARQGIAEKSTNFEQTLPSPQSELVQQALKDPYIFNVRHGTWTAFLTQSGGYVEGGT